MAPVNPRALRSHQPKPAASNAPESAYPVTYGVEIEMEGVSLRAASRAVRAAVASSFSHGATSRMLACATGSTPPKTLDVCDRAGRTWRVEPEHDGVEVVSPILTNAQDLHHLQNVARALAKAGAYVTDNLGLHIHIGARAFSPYQIAHLLALVHHYESALFMALGVHAQRRTRWCAPLPDTVVEAVVRAAPTSHASFKQAYRSAGASSRYRSVNLENMFYATPNKNTIEFRLFNATLCPSAIACHVSLVMGLASKALAAPSLPDIGKHLAPPPPFNIFVAASLDAPACAHLTQGLDHTLGEMASDTPYLVKLLAVEKYVGPLARMLSLGVPPADLQRWAQKTSPQGRADFIVATCNSFALTNAKTDRSLLFAVLQTEMQVPLSVFSATLARLLAFPDARLFGNELLTAVMGWPASQREGILQSLADLRWACLIAVPPSALPGLRHRLVMLGLVNSCRADSDIFFATIKKVAQAVAYIPTHDLDTFATTLSNCCTALAPLGEDTDSLRMHLAMASLAQLQQLEQRLSDQGLDNIDICDPLTYVTDARARTIATAIEVLYSNSSSHPFSKMRRDPRHQLISQLANLSDARFKPTLDVLLVLRQKCRGCLKLPDAAEGLEAHSPTTLRAMRNWMATASFAVSSDYRAICDRAAKAVGADSAWLDD